MKRTIQAVTLRSEKHFGRKVPPKAFGELLRVFPEIIRASIRMAFESRSQASGARPRWLTEASDIRFLDHSGDDETVLHFDAPKIGDAAKVLYRQLEIWPTRPDPNDTGFDLLGDVINDVSSGNADSNRFDRRLLAQIERFRHGLSGAFQSIEYFGNRHKPNHPIVISAQVIDAATKLSRSTPESQQARLVGTLDMIRSSTNAFAVKLDDGNEVAGVLLEGKVAQIRPLLERKVLVLGKAIYRPSGRLLRLDADEVIDATEQGHFFSRIPKPQRSRIDLHEVLKEQRHKKGISAIFGQWPGEETDEEVALALNEVH